MKKQLLTIGICAMLSANYLNAQIISTFAGNGTLAYTGNGGQATVATLNFPAGIVFDAAGNVYIADFGNNVIRKVNTAGIISTIAGNGTAAYTGDGGQATAAGLNTPTGVFIDASGNGYIADNGNDVIRKVSAAGIISTYAGNGTPGYTGDGGQATVATLNAPAGVAFDAIGNVYIADNGNNVIRKVNSAGIISTIAGNGTAAYTGDGGQATVATLNAPAGVAFDAIGNVYIADNGNNVIRKVNTAGIISTYAGNGTAAYTGDGGQATVATLNAPVGVAFDASGNVYIADQGNNRIRTVSTAGIISTIAGNGTAAYTGDGGQATAAGLNTPTGVAIGASGNTYIADNGNQRIRKVTNCALSSNQPTITVNSGTICAGSSFTMSPSGANTYTYSSGTAVVTPTITSSYSVTGTNSAGCMSSNTAVSTVTVSVCGAGIEQLRMQNAELSIYPNPTSSMLNLSISQFEDLKMQDVEVTNILGEIVIHNSSLITHNLALDVSGLPAGVYFVRLGTATQKFIKQ